MNKEQNKSAASRWSKAEAIAAIAAAAAVIVTYFNYELWQDSRDAVVAANKQVELAKKTYEAETRAYIVPTGAKMLGPIAPGKPLDIEIAYRNSGHEPAVISSDNQAYTVTGFVKTRSGLASDIPKVQNKTCPQGGSGQQGLVVYPHFYRDYTSRLKVPADAIPADFFSGRSTLYITGCITYRTLKTIHHSGYCFYLRPGPADDELNWQFLFCGDGNFAD